MKTRTIRYLLVGLFGVWMLGLCLWLTHGSISVQLDWPRRKSVSIFKQLDKSIAYFRAKNGRLPRELIELENLPDGYLKPSRDWSIKDLWRNSIVYEVQGDSYLLISLGADRKVGGVGIDCDITSKNPNPPESKATFVQALTNTSARGMLIASLVCVILAVILASRAVKERDLEFKNLPVLLLKSVIAFVGVSFVAMFVLALHVPSGH